MLLTLLLLVICLVLMLWNHVGVRGITMPRCYRPYYFSFSSGDLSNTSSHVCGSWYLSKILFGDGSITLINIASLMVLAIFWSSLPTILKLSRDT